jgi:hypothetical protein
MKTFEYTWSFKETWQKSKANKSKIEALNLDNAKILLYQEYGPRIINKKLGSYVDSDVVVDFNSIKEVE